MVWLGYEEEFAFVRRLIGVPTVKKKQAYIRFDERFQIFHVKFGTSFVSYS
jgi:hypothetical protein